MKINYDFPWYLQNSEGFMALYTGLYDVATNISPISLLSALDIDHTTTPEQLKLIATLYGLRGDFVAIQDALIYNIKKWSGRLEVPEDEGTQVEYIQMTSTYSAPTYLVMDVVPQSNYKIEVEFVINNLINGEVGVICGCDTSGQGSPTVRCNLIIPAGNTRCFRAYGFNGTAYDSTTEVIPNQNYTYIWDNGTAKVYKGSSIVFEHTFEPTGTNTQGFGINTQKSVDYTSISPGTYSYKRVRIWDNNGILVANYVPCVKDNVVGFYDTVTGVLKTATGGTFVAGPESAIGEFEENYWSGRVTETTDLLVNYIKAKVQIRNKNLTLQTLKQFFEVCLAHRDFNPSTDISVEESTLHFDLTITVDGDILNDMVTLLSVDPYPFGKPTGISYSINYVQE